MADFDFPRLAQIIARSPNVFEAAAIAAREGRSAEAIGRAIEHAATMTTDAPVSAWLDSIRADAERRAYDADAHRGAREVAEAEERAVELVAGRRATP